MMQEAKQTMEQWFDRGVREFIQYCKAENHLPSDFALLEFFGMDVETLQQLQKGEAFAPSFDLLRLFREHRLLQQLEEVRSNATGIVFQLKQVKNGGYQDHGPTGSEGAAFLLKIDGVGGTEAFG